MLSPASTPALESSESTVEGEGPDGTLADGALAKRFLLAGNARATFVSKKTGVRFTFRVRASDDGKCHFVSVLTGSNNDADYSFLGTIFAEERVQVGGGSFGPVYGQRAAAAPKFVHGKKSRIGRDAPSAKAFAWAWEQLAHATLPAALEVHHEGRCGRCGRALTVPSSVISGLGPICAGEA